MALIVSFTLGFLFIRFALGYRHNNEVDMGLHLQPRSERKVIDVAFYVNEDSSNYFLNATIGTSDQTQIVDFALDLNWGDTFVDPTSYNCTTHSSCRSNIGYFNQSQEFGEYIAGPYSQDMFKIDGTNISIPNFQFVQATSPIGVEGSIGLGPLIDEGNITDYQYPNFVQSLVNEGLINSYAYSIYLDELNGSSGHLLLGGVNEGTLQTQLVHLEAGNQEFTQPLGYQAQIILQSLTLTLENGTSVVLGSKIPVILSSTSSTTFTANIYQALFAAIGTYDDGPQFFEGGDQEWTAAPCSLLNGTSTLSYTFSNELEVRTPLLGLIAPSFDPSSCYLESTSNSLGHGETSIGFDVIKQLVTVFDYTNMQISLGLNSFQSGSDNFIEIPIEGLSKMSIGPSPNPQGKSLKLPLGVGLGIGIPFFLLVCWLVWRICRRQQRSQISNQEFTGKGELPAEGIRRSETRSFLAEIGADGEVQNHHPPGELEGTHGVSEAATSNPDYNKLIHVVVELPAD